MDGERRRNSDRQLGELVGLVNAMVKSVDNVQSSQKELNDDMKEYHKSLMSHLIEDAGIHASIYDLMEWRRDKNGNGAEKDIDDLKTSKIKFLAYIFGLGTTGGFAGHKMGAIWDKVSSFWGS